MGERCCWCVVVMLLSCGAQPLTTAETRDALGSSNPNMNSMAFTVAGAGTFQAWLYVPPSYASQPSRAYPLVVAMHGLGEQGSNLNQLTSAGGSIPNVINGGFNPEALVVAPQLNYQRDEAFALAYLEVLIAQVKANYRVDPARLHLTGLSMGSGFILPYLVRHRAEVASFSLMSNRCSSTSISTTEYAELARLPNWHSQSVGDATGCATSIITALNASAPAVPPVVNFYCSTSATACVRTASGVTASSSSTCSTSACGHADGWTIPYAPQDVIDRPSAWWQWVLSQALAGDGGVNTGGFDAGTLDAGVRDAGTLDAGTLDAGTRDAGSLDAGTLDAGTLDAGTLDAGTLDAGTLDAGTLDAGTLDAGTHDAGTLDAGTLDAGTLDAGTLAAGTLDAGTLDAGTLDAGALDAGALDAGALDAGTLDAGDGDLSAEPATGQCGCQSTPGTALLSVLMFALSRRRRDSSNPRSSTARNVSSR
jgi:uncharacterized protein (TIGR03382 family)